MLISLFIDYILLRLTARVTHSGLGYGRAMLGAVVGSMEGLLVLLPPMPVGVSVVCKAAGSVVICLAAFGFRSRERLFWHWVCFVGLSCLLAGMLLALSLMGADIYYANGSWYPDISLKELAVFTIGAYVVLCILQRIRDRSTADAACYSVTIRYGHGVVRLEGLADTGNSLVDFYTGKPVILCSRAALAPLLPERLPPGKLRPLPCTTVAGEGLVMCFRPDETVIRSDHSCKSVDVLIGITGQEEPRAIFNPKLLRY